MDFCFTVEENRSRLFAAIDALDWRRVQVADRSVERGHGRIATRTIQVQPAPPDLPFPHGGQVWLIERYVTDTAGTPPVHRSPRSPPWA